MAPELWLRLIPKWFLVLGCTFTARLHMSCVHREYHPTLCNLCNCNCTIVPWSQEMYIKLLATPYEMVYIHHTHQAHEVAPCSAKVWIAAPTSDLASHSPEGGSRGHSANDWIYGTKYQQIDYKCTINDIVTRWGNLLTIWYIWVKLLVPWWTNKANMVIRFHVRFWSLTMEEVHVKYEPGDNKLTAKIWRCSSGKSAILTSTLIEHLACMDTVTKTSLKPNDDGTTTSQRGTPTVLQD